MIFTHSTMEATDLALGAGRMGKHIISMILHMIIEMPILIGPIVQDVESAPADRWWHFHTNGGNF